MEPPCLPVAPKTVMIFLDAIAVDSEDQADEFFGETGGWMIVEMQAGET